MNKKYFYFISNNSLILVQAILFIVFLLFSFFYNRYAADDFYFIGELKTKSFLEIYQHLYFDWHGRWTSNFLMVAFIQLHELSYFLFFFNLFSVGTIYLLIYRIIKSISSFYVLKVDKSTLYIYAIIALCLFFFCTISPGDSWFWYTSSVVYLWSIIAFLATIPIFFKNKKKTLDYLFLIFGAIYIGGSNEPLAIFSLFVLLFLIHKKRERNLSFFTLILLLSSFLINFSSPGTISRDSITPNLNEIDLILYTGYGFLKFLFFNFYKTFLPALFLAFSFYHLGKKTPPITYSFKPKKDGLKSILGIAIIVLFNQVIVIYPMGGLPPDRSTITASICISALLIRFFFLLGNKTRIEIKSYSKIIWINSIGLLLFTIYFTKVHFTYAKAMDNRIKSINIGVNKVIYLSPLPISGYLYSGEITKDPNHYKNQHFRSGLGIKKEIILID